ncbi:MAG: SDR family oxidoreductase [Rhodobacteraceae bacterium]|nr:SDR family oxidoreductase [Paracoccaceae bacterium]
MPSVLITGANRGLGLGLLKLYVADGWRVFGCCRNPAKAKQLKAIAAKSGGRLTLHKLDVEKPDTIKALKKVLKKQPIDMLLNVAGYYGKSIMTEPGGRQEFGKTDYKDWDKVFAINVKGPMRMSEAFADNVARSDRKILVTFSSIVGSIALNNAGALYPYRASKAAVNMMMKSMAHDLKAKGIIALPFHPGWVRTEMGGPAADLDPGEAAAMIKKALGGIKKSHAGKFLDYRGKFLPW